MYAPWERFSNFRIRANSYCLDFLQIFTDAYAWMLFSGSRAFWHDRCQVRNRTRRVLRVNRVRLGGCGEWKLGGGILSRFRKQAAALSGERS